MGVDLPRITLVTTGGTIEQLGPHRLDTRRYVEEGRRLEPGALLCRLPEIDRLARVDEVQFGRLDSSNTCPSCGADSASSCRTTSTATTSTAS